MTHLHDSEIASLQAAHQRQLNDIRRHLSSQPQPMTRNANFVEYVLPYIKDGGIRIYVVTIGKPPTPEQIAFAKQSITTGGVTAIGEVEEAEAFSKRLIAFVEAKPVVAEA